MGLNIRIDKFLWCIRLYKTRALSNAACNKSKIKVNTKKVKASYLVKINDIISIKKKMINIEIRVESLLGKRVSAKLINEYIKDITPDSEKMKFEISKKIPVMYREKGSGRPTKKERRDLMRQINYYSEE